MARHDSTAVAGCSEAISSSIARKTAELVEVSDWEKFLPRPKQRAHRVDLADQSITCTRLVHLGSGGFQIEESVARDIMRIHYLLLEAKST